MKTKLSFLYLLSFVLCLSLCPSPCALSQIPQGFNYQAVAHTSAGGPISNTSIQVKMGILSDTLTPVVVWEELHSSVKTNLNGVFNLVIGSGIRQSGSATVFSDIDWKISPLYLKIQIYYQGAWKYLGSAKLWSVPYAMVAGNMGGPVSKLSVEGETSSADEALFEVKNKDGQTIFAVYNEGVRIYVDDGAKGPKGGFAVGGFDMTKATKREYFVVSDDSVRIYLDSNPATKGKKSGFAVGGYDMTKGDIQNYLDVSADSVRIYIDSNPATKKLKGGFAVGGYDMTKGTNTNYMNVNTDASGIINPAQNRILWYPMKNAFLTGKVLVEDKDSVGINSFASGYESKAKGQYSQALGYKAVARGDYSTSIGRNAIAQKVNSFAFGEGAIANNSESYAIGREAVAYGYRSFAIGSAGRQDDNAITGPVKAIGDYSFAVGQGSLSTGIGSFSFGIADTAKNNFTLATGYQSTASGYGSVAIGYHAEAKGIQSIAMGLYSKAIGSYSTAIGPHANATSDYAIALGYETIAGLGSTATGYYTNASGNVSTAMGYRTNATGHQSTAMGAETKASGTGSVAMGTLTEASGLWSLAAGKYSIASGNYSVAMGEYNKATGPNSTALGRCNNARGKYSTALGESTDALSGFETVIGRYNSLYTPVDTTHWSDNDRLFVVGNGTSEMTRSNAMTVLKNGNVGIGTTSPSYKLTVSGTAWCSSGVWTGSDIRWKENILPLSDALTGIKKLNPVSYNLKTDEFPQMGFEEGNQFGLIAQEVEKIYPELVRTDNQDYKSVSYEKLSVVLLEAVKEQQFQIETQNQKIKQLYDLIEQMQDKIASLRSQ